MKPLRLVSTPTRNRRLNEILGLVAAVCAVLLFLALATYTPADPSLNTVGGIPPGSELHATLGASNWTGVVGAYIADVLLQMIGIAAFFLPIVLARVGICWIRQRPAGSASARFAGLGLWLLFAPALLGLLPHTLYWRHALPIEGVSGRLISDLLVQYLNLPGATIVLLLMVAVSLYLALVTQACLELAGVGKQIIIEGPLARNASRIAVAAASNSSRSTDAAALAKLSWLMLCVGMTWTWVCGTS